MSIATFFVAGGWTMFATRVLGVFGIASALRSLRLALGRDPNRMLGAGVLSVSLALATLGMGTFGYWLGLRAVDTALLQVAPEDRAELEAFGRAEADNNLVLGGLLMVVPLLAGLVAIGRGASLRT